MEQARRACTGCCAQPLRASYMRNGGVRTILWHYAQGHPHLYATQVSSVRLGLLLLEEH